MDHNVLPPAQPTKVNPLDSIVHLHFLIWERKHYLIGGENEGMNGYILGKKIQSVTDCIMHACIFRIHFGRKVIDCLLNLDCEKGCKTEGGHHNARCGGFLTG
jgi:hypothetical protein